MLTLYSETRSSIIIDAFNETLTILKLFMLYHTLLKDIHLPKHTLNKANLDNKNASYLDLDPSINNYSQYLNEGQIE